MRKTILLLVSLLTLVCPLMAQTGKYFANAEGAVITPLGTLADRFKNTASGAISFGYKTSENWIWFGKLEYFKFDKLNEDKMYIDRKVLVSGSNVIYRAPLTGIKMDLTIAGLSANAKYNLVRTKLFETNVDLGFGIYRWLNHRSGLDSVTIDTSYTSGVHKYHNLLKDVPPSHQQDWSGGFNLGAELVFHIIDPISITIAGNYKNIIGELWPALALDIENTSSFQMVEYKAGIRIKF